MIKHYFNKDPDRLTDEEWSLNVEEAVFVARFQADLLSKKIGNEIAKIVSQLFKK